MGMLLQTIQDNSSSNLGYKVNLASAIFVQDGYPIRTIYNDISQTFYRGDAYNVNFENGEEAENTVTEWVRINTNSKISKILEKTPDSKTKVIIAGVLYFNAEWETPFWEGGTDKRPFYMNGINSKSTTIDMMTTGGVFPYYHDTYFNCEILGLPYKGNKTTMFIIKPKNSSKEKLKQLQLKLTPYDLERLIKSTTDATRAVGFPKMRLESFHNLAKPLRLLGVKSLFIRTNANLALLSPGRIRPGAPNRMGFDSNLTKYDVSVIIFSRFSSHENCTEIFDLITNISKCEYSSIRQKVKPRIARQLNSGEALDYLRASLPDSDNPGIFANDVFHEVYIDINEKGTEAVAATSVSSGKGGDIVTFRADTPFLFYIWNHDAQVVLF